MTSAISIALSGLTSSTQRLNASAANIANLQTIGSLEEGGQAPYSAVTTTSSAQTVGNGEGAGVVTQIIPKDTPFVPVFSPDSPFADENGVVGVPNVNLAEEIVNINLAEITYKANLKTIQAASDLDKELFRILDQKA
ncbi:MAG: hypothetical protein DHS20C02_19650 [Micavibrio sp.]|nr:MAG: hypothetical protein DHS20C02_19650 [Micavibrio sp.]